MSRVDSRVQQTEIEDDGDSVTAHDIWFAVILGVGLFCMTVVSIFNFLG